MYKIEIDPITKKILSCSEVLQNTPVYSDDIIVSAEYLSGFDPKKNMIMDADGTLQEDDCEDEIAEIQKRTDELSRESEQDYFMRLVIDEGRGVSTARTLVKERRGQIESLTKELEEKKAEHEAHIREYYLNLDRENDAKLNCRYYSAVIMVIKHENRYLREWIDWHLNLGFEHIYLYDNGTEERVTEITETYPAVIREKITVTDWSGHHVHLQQNAYEHFMQNFKQDVRWGIFIDSDEFVRFTGITTDVNRFLRGYEDYTEIWGYEVEYDANGLVSYEDKPVHERFTRITDVREGFYWKNFVQPNRIDGWLMHYAQYNPRKHFVFENEERNKDLFIIEHFYTKSWEEWQWKIKDRGGADPKYHKRLQEFFTYNPDLAYLNTGEDAVQAYE